MTNITAVNIFAVIYFMQIYRHTHSTSSREGMPYKSVKEPGYTGVWGSAVSSPSGVWSRAPAEIDFGAFWP